MSNESQQSIPQPQNFIRAGRITVALSLVSIGVLLLLDVVFKGNYYVRLLTTWWPLILVCWGCEVAVRGLLARRSKRQWKIDFAGISTALIIAVSVFTVAQPYLFRDWVRSIQFDFSMMKQMIALDGIPVPKPTIKEELPAQADQFAIRHTKGDIYVETGDVEQLEIESIVTVYDATREEAETVAANIDLQVIQGDASKLILDSSRYVDGTEPKQDFQLDLRITLPREQDIELDIQLSQGDVYAQRIVAPIYVQSSEGDVRIVDARDRVEVRSSTGDIELNDILGPALMQTSKGDLYGERLEADAELRTQSGHIELEEVYGSLHAEANEGDVNVRSSKLSSYWSVDSLKGNVNLTLPPDANVDADLHTVMDSIETNYLTLDASETTYIGKIGEGGFGLRVRAFGHISLQHE